jgi:UDP-glucose 4-epimerase
MKRVLVTGSSGYIGQHLVKLLKKEFSVDGLDLTIATNTELFFNLDIRNSNLNLEQEYDTVVHLAALVNVGDSVHDPISYYNTNINGTVNILKNIKCKNFIFASTGAAKQLSNPYGISKRVAEDIVNKYCQDNNINYTIFRFYNVIGQDGFEPTNPDGLFFNLIKACRTGEFNLYGDNYNTKDGSCVRDYVHVMEVCHSITTAITTPANNLENLGHGRGYTVKEIINIFKKVNDCDFNIIVKNKRDGDLETSVLKNVSKYMVKLYSITELLKVKL